MIEYLKIIVEVIGHIIWPLSILIIFLLFRKEVKSLIKRLRSAKIKDFQIELDKRIEEKVEEKVEKKVEDIKFEEKIDDIRKDAIDYGVTMIYPSETIEKEFNPMKELTKTYVIIETWKEIESLIQKLDDRENNYNISDSINYLVKNQKIQKYLAKMILALRELRNIAAHKSESSIDKEDYQNWVSISKSVIDRLKSNR